MIEFIEKRKIDEFTSIDFLLRLITDKNRSSLEYSL